MEVLTKKTIKNTYAVITNRSLLFQIIETANHHGLSTDVEMGIFRNRGKNYIITTDGMIFHAVDEVPDTPKELTQISKYQLIDYIGNYKRRVIHKAKQVYHEQ